MRAGASLDLPTAMCAEIKNKGKGGIGVFREVRLDDGIDYGEGGLCMAKVSFSTSGKKYGE